MTTGFISGCETGVSSTIGFVGRAVSTTVCKCVGIVAGVGSLIIGVIWLIDYLLSPTAETATVSPFFYGVP